MRRESRRAFLGAMGAALVPTVFLLVALLVILGVGVVGAYFIISKGDFASGFICLALICFAVLQIYPIIEELK